MIWDNATRDEIEHLLRQIPCQRICFATKTGLPARRIRGDFDFVPDPADRNFAALAHAARVPLVTSDAGLLNAHSLAALPILKPSEFPALREA